MYASVPRDTIAECPSCGAQWPVFAEGPKALEPSPDVSVEVIETERSYEVDHVEPLELDNLGGMGSMKHTLTRTQEWTQTLEVNTEKAKTEDATSGADIPGIGTFSRKTEEAVKSTYSITEETRKELTREFTFEVPAHTQRNVSFIYRRVWQHGFARLRRADDATIEIPFRVAVDMTIDLAAQDTIA